jgi:plasmid stabilization system protein ParE
MNLAFHPLVEDDLVEGASFYEARNPGLGTDFLVDVRRAAQDLARAPERWPRVEGTVRRCLLRRFPYALFYRHEPDRVLVLAVHHTRRRPGSWKTRL